MKRLTHGFFVCALVCAAIAGARAQEAIPVARVTIYPGDRITEAMLDERADAAPRDGEGLYIRSRDGLIGKVARRTLLPRQPIPAMAVDNPRVVTVGAQVKVDLRRVRASHRHLWHRSAGRRRRRPHSRPQSGQRPLRFRPRAKRRVDPRRRRLMRSLVALCILLLAPAALADVRIKDITAPVGPRDYQLIGYGLVIGLQGTGDTLRNAPFTEQSASALLDRMGVNVKPNNTMRTRNVAAVMVTSSLPPFVSWGSTIDVTVSSLGDATSLMGGTLVLTSLTGIDGVRLRHRAGSDRRFRLRGAGAE